MLSALKNTSSDTDTEVVGGITLTRDNLSIFLSKSKFVQLIYNTEDFQGSKSLTHNKRPKLKW